MSTSHPFLYNWLEKFSERIKSQNYLSASLQGLKTTLVYAIAALWMQWSQRKSLPRPLFFNTCDIVHMYLYLFECNTMYRSEM